MQNLHRREFLKLSGALTAGALLLGSGCAPKPAKIANRPQPTVPARDQAYLAVARGLDPAKVTRVALAALGGIERFVKAGQEVIVKPNIGFAYHGPEYATTTNPQVVAALVTLCLEAGAKRVRVMDMPSGGTPAAAYSVSGIEEAVKAAGGEMTIMSHLKYARYEIPEGRDITEWEIYQDVMETDVLIDVPIAKHHSLARITAGSKNLLGVVAQPNRIHRNLGQRIADLVSVIRPTLTVVDAVRILTNHGPTGGSLNDVQQTDTVIASHDIVCADAYAATLFGLQGEDISYIKAAADQGLGILDLKSIPIEEISVS